MLPAIARTPARDQMTRRGRTEPASAREVTRSRSVKPMADGLDLDAMIERFRERSAAVKRRQLPPIGGEERTLFLRQAQNDFQDFAMIGDATATLEDGVLLLRIDLRPKG